jgi:acetoin utilization deacetylase AcuC-like enzyme
MDDLVFYYPQGHEGHFEAGHPERPERVEAIRTALEEHGLTLTHIRDQPHGSWQLMQLVVQLRWQKLFGRVNQSAGLP